MLYADTLCLGADYLPATLPVLGGDISNLTVVLSLAPRRYHIVTYHLVIKSVNVTANFTRIVVSNTKRSLACFLDQTAQCGWNDNSDSVSNRHVWVDVPYNKCN